jgi:hypothetical protein
VKTYLLTTIRKEGPIHAAVLKSDIRTMAKAGADLGDLDENRVIRLLTELESEGTIRRTMPGGNEWEAIFAAEAVKPKQGMMF